MAASLAAVPCGLTVLPTAAQDTSVSALERGSVERAQAQSKLLQAVLSSSSVRGLRASYGHMYVLYGQLNGRGEIVKSDIAGFHSLRATPTTAKIAASLAGRWGTSYLCHPKQGQATAISREKYVTARYRVMLDAASFKKISAHIRQLKGRAKRAWNALINNCVTFGK